MALESGARTFAIPPYARGEFTVAFEYRTQVLRTRDGTEQRRARRERPRQQVSFPVRNAGDCLRTVLREIAAHQRWPFAVADLSRRIYAAGALANGGDTMAVASAPAFIASGEALILISGARVEKFTVASFAAGVITFNETNTGAAFPAGTSICPALPARMADRLSGRRSNPARGEIAFAFELTPGYALAYTPPSTPATFNGRELFTLAPRNIAPVTLEFLSELERVDPGFGAVAFATPIDFPTAIERYDYGPFAASCARQVEDLFHRMRGAQGSFYLPTFAADFRPVGTSSSGTNDLTVAGDVASDFAASTVYDQIAVQYADGSWQALGVTGMTPSGANTVLTLSANLSADVSAASVKRISWLPRRRFLSDTLEARWRNDVCRLSIAVQTLENS